ncbi:MAG: MarR family transcriptional regulator [Actinomycetota bacterium]
MAATDESTGDSTGGRTPGDPDDELLTAERDVQARLGDRPLDFASLDAVSNLYRTAAAVRRRAEAGVLAEQNLSFGGFTILWVLWVWGEMETARLAEECSLAKGTLTGMLTTLEKRQLVERHPIAADRRRVLVTLTPDGEALIDELFPRFNRFEGEMTGALSGDEKRELARLLRLITTRAADTEG